MSHTLIIGAGLCGLALADALQARGADYLLLEARDRIGGRILSDPVDLGPAWFWPGQPRMAALVDRLALLRFEQFATGAALFEGPDGTVQRGRGLASMAGSWRVAGGLSALTAALAQTVPQERLRLNTHVTGVERMPEGVKVQTRDGAFEADRVVLALPPRLAAGLVFTPALPGPVAQAMAQVPTWMAGQAKAVAVYPTPFWRDVGLSGDGISRRGPMVELHDASPKDASYGALFGFVGVPPAARLDTAALRTAVRAQLDTLFGGAAPASLHIKDWAQDPLTATPADAAPLRAHPLYGLPFDVQHLWDGRVVLSGSETAPTFGGYLEGALEAAEAALATVTG